MKKNKGTEKHIKDIYLNKLKVTTNSNLDKRVITNSMNALEGLKNKNLANIQANLWITVAKNRITKVAAVLILLSAICLLILRDRGQLERHETNGSEVALSSKTPSELVSAITLNIAFRDGGMQAIQKQFDKAESKVKPGLKTRLTIDQLISELQGCKEI